MFFRLEKFRVQSYEKKYKEQSNSLYFFCILIKLFYDNYFIIILFVVQVFVLCLYSLTIYMPLLRVVGMNVDDIFFCIDRKSVV